MSRRSNGMYVACMGLLRQIVISLIYVSPSLHSLVSNRAFNCASGGNRRGRYCWWSA